MTSVLGKQNIPSIKRSIESDAALLPYLIHQLGSAHEWSGVCTGIRVRSHGAPHEFSTA